MNIFYTSGTQWFDNVANGCIWALIAATLAFAIWLGYDVITGPAKQQAEVTRLLDGLDTSVAQVSSHKASGSSPFAPKRKLNKEQVKADLTAS